jgi:acyl-CoA thioesterase YciA
MELITRHLCKTSDLGVHGNLFGGRMLSWLDEAAAMMVTRICKTKSMVTIKMDEIIFHTPVKENHNVNIYGEVVGIGTTSISVKLVAKKYDVYNESEVDVCSVSMVFVHITDEMKTRAIASDVRKKYKRLTNKKVKDGKKGV